ncbi:hypothetical protein ASE67_02435 [Sphingomonas sp. Leaf23]|uniref:hypothetical protein n=1 Tax=Sphingomonas sp. Leaf23 TaxID=1735689 RepID=UPI0006FE0C03|nr:hypothetical protein [Sphingomonas sp. Leaf23]KQM88617.1 hypothetical protein ASE67_02435 [Sphingomonas sp. Leaf23]
MTREQKAIKSLCKTVGTYEEVMNSPIADQLLFPVGDIVAAMLAFADAEAAAMRERAAIAARDAMCDQEWPPTDGDRQIDEVLAAIRALPATGEVGRV